MNGKTVCVVFRHGLSAFAKLRLSFLKAPSASRRVAQSQHKSAVFPLAGLVQAFRSHHGSPIRFPCTFISGSLCWDIDIWPDNWAASPRTDGRTLQPLSKFDEPGNWP